MSDSSTPLRKTPLDGLHRELGAKMVPFAGYEMPVQYPDGILKEHLHTRAQAGLFDVSHMGQVILRGPDPAAALEKLVPGDIVSLGTGQMRYTQFTDDSGGILDDLMVMRREDDLFLVVNAACKEADVAHLTSGMTGHAVEYLGERGLLALQGPLAAEVLAAHAPEVRSMPFMSGREVAVAGVGCIVSRSGYTGEDGFELSMPTEQAETVARALLSDVRVKPIGLGARDSLRLEAGLCLYGHDIDTTTTPIEAGLAWSISKRRRAEGGFPGASVVQRQLAEGPPRRRVGIRPEGRVVAREGVEMADRTGNVIGAITSGGFGPSVNGPVAMGYVETAHAGAGTEVQLLVRGSARPAAVAKLPFVAQRYYRGA
jgi:aminomethyltransferase